MVCGGVEGGRGHTEPHGTGSATGERRGVS